MKKMRFSGLVNSNPEVLKLMDRDIESDSLVVPVTLTSKGTVRSSKQAVSGADLNVMSRYVTDLIAGLGRRIVSGDVAIPVPDGANRFTGPDCSFCPYGSVCALKKKKTTVVKPKSNDEWIALMQQKDRKKEQENA